MNDGRWYPTTTVLANGDVLVVSGHIDLTVGVNMLPQVFQVATGTWRSLTNAQLQRGLYPMICWRRTDEFSMQHRRRRPAISIRRGPAPGATSRLGSAESVTTGQR